MTYLEDMFLCTKRGCVSPRSTSKYCREHADEYNKKQKLKRLKRKENGLCSKCNNTRLELSNLCLWHWMKRLSKRYLLDENRACELFKKLKDQDFKCFYTQEKLIIGENVSLDHIKPYSQFKDLRYDINNLVFCTLKINKMKLDYSLIEFIEMCKNVIENENIIKLYENQLSGETNVKEG